MAGKSPRIDWGRGERSFSPSCSPSDRARRRRRGRPSSVRSSRDNTNATQDSVVRRFPLRASGDWASHQEERHEQEHDSGAHHDNQDEGTRRRDDDPDAPRKQKNQSEEADEDTRLPLPGDHLVLHPPPFGQPRGFRLHAPSFERAYLMTPTRADAQVFCTNPRMGRRSMGAKRDLVSILDMKDDLVGLLELAASIKNRTKAGEPYEPLRGKSLAMIFEKASTRTRVSFEVGMTQLGGHALFLSPSDLQLGRGETIADTARVLSRYVDGIMYRAFRRENVLELARNASVPVINGLDDKEHPCQVIAD